MKYTILLEYSGFKCMAVIPLNWVIFTKEREMTMTFYKQKTTLLLLTKLLTQMYVTGMISWSLTHVKIKAAC